MREVRNIWKSYVWHGDQCFFVSTIERPFDSYVGPHIGHETIVWEYDYDKGERGKLLFEAGGIADHQEICRNVIASGVAKTNEYYDES